MLCRLQETFDHYAKAGGLGSETKVAAALERWGPNLFDVPLPKFSALLQVPFLPIQRPGLHGLPSACGAPRSLQTTGQSWRLKAPDPAVGTPSGAVFRVPGVLRRPVGSRRLLVRVLLLCRRLRIMLARWQAPDPLVDRDCMLHGTRHLTAKAAPQSTQRVYHGLQTGSSRACRYYSLFTLGMLVMFECTVVGSRIRNVRELRSLQTPKQGIQVSCVAMCCAGLRAMSLYALLTCHSPVSRPS